MTAFLFTLFFTALFMWLFFKFMYPKPPKAFMPQEGDIVTARDCDFCGHPLAEYRGVLEQKPQSALSPTELAASTRNLAVQKQASQHDNKPDSPLVDEQKHKGLSRQQKKAIQQALDKQQQEAFQQQQAVKKMTTWFFCNYEHQAAFHAQQQTAKEDGAKQSSDI